MQPTKRKGHIEGVGIKGTHTTLIDLAAKIIKIIRKLKLDLSISLGYIQTGKGVSGGSQSRVKVKLLSGCLLLVVRQARSVQELRVYASDLGNALEVIVAALREDHIQVQIQETVSE